MMCPIFEYECECGTVAEIITNQKAEHRCERCGKLMKVRVSGQARTPGGWA